MSKERIYAAIDLKSFYASVECVERKLDPLTTNLVVADPSRTEKTICLAVTPSLKSIGIAGRARLFEVISAIKKYNFERKRKYKLDDFSGKSTDLYELTLDPTLATDFIIAPPRMALYIEYSTRIYEIYLKYVAPEDIHVYSIDEAFMDITDYLNTAKMTAREFVKTIITDIISSTGITAAAGIGTNLYLCKVAMDITAKHIKEDKDGVRIAVLDEMTYRKTLWDHTPITDFWRVGGGYAASLQAYGMYTMGDVAKCSLNGENILYRIFGVNAELLIDHAWGYEPCTIKDIKNYKPETNSISSGQVLHEPYDYSKTKLVVREMADMLSLELFEKGLVTNQLVIQIGYDSENLINSEIADNLFDEVTTDFYGRKIPKHARGTVNMPKYTSSSKMIVQNVMQSFEKIYKTNLLSRRITLTACNVVSEDEATALQTPTQLDIFTDYEKLYEIQEKENAETAKEKSKQKALIKIKNKYGKNAILKGMNFEEGATAKDRNKQIGGHKK